MRKSIWTPLLLAVIVIVVAFLAVRFFTYNTGVSAYTPPERPLSTVEFEASAIVPFQKIADNPTINKGVVVVDYAHNNALFIEELNVLFSKIVSRGFSYEIVFPQENTGESVEEGQGIINKLRYAQALILPLPRLEYTAEELDAIQRFVEKGGQVLIIGDPTRTIIVESLNSVASPFGVIFANDYLYSLENNDNNYRNVIYTNFEDSPITNGLGEEDRIVFYSGNSVSAPGHEIILGDDTTKSSISETSRQLAAAALTTNDQVLALGDLTFLGEPYSAAESNGKLINNIADFLTDTERSFNLRDFPYFFNQEVDVVFDNSLVFNSQFEDSVQLKDMLEENDRVVSYLDEIPPENDVIFVGRFSQTEPVAPYLNVSDIKIIKDEDPAEEEAEAGAEETAPETESVQPEAPAEAENGEEQASPVSDVPSVDDQDQEFVEGRIQISGTGELELGGSTLFHLFKENGRNILIILSDNPDTNADAFELLLNNEFTECMVNPVTAVCQTEEPDKRQPPSLRSDRIDKILVVSDDDGREREDAQTSLVEYNNVLSATYRVDTWLMSDGDPLDLDELQEYDAIIWTTGDYWDDSIGPEEAELLTSYIEAGGNLILSGASIAFDWDHTDFLENIVHADYLTFAEQEDIEVALADHPIAKGFTEGQVITFTATSSDEPLEPDVVAHTPNSRVIFQRGPDSEQTGAASVIAYEDDRAKIAYYAFPFYLLPAPNQAALVNNTIDWFTRRPLDPPSESDFSPFEADDDSGPSDEDEATDEEGESEEGENGGEGEEDTGGEDEGGI